MATLHIVGAGLAGLACAVAMVGRGWRVALYEAAPHAGGRCRSFYDHTLERRLDNGNHLMMSANRATLAYLARIGASGTMICPVEAAYPFVDLASGARWVLRPNQGSLPWWLLIPSRRVPGSRPIDYLSGLAIFCAGSDATVAECIPRNHRLYRSFWEPLTLAALNCSPEMAAARPLGAVMRETFARGGRFCRPMIARDGLASSLVEPALALLAGHDESPRFGQRLRAVRFEGGRVCGLDFTGNGEAHGITLGPDDMVVLALPPSITGELLPGQIVPEDGHVIVNAHFRLEREPPPLPYGMPFIGVVGGAAHWVFVRGDVASVTVSGASAMAEQPAAAIADLLWRDVALALALPAGATPPARIIKEKRATFVQSPANQRRRPETATRWSNLFIAGDWTATGLPCTIEGAIRSGNAAAAAVTGKANRP
ncbi:MAG: hydroxysqualene dehydroxylase HpnE [Rhodospirillaceae bacterium]